MKKITYMYIIVAAILLILIAIYGYNKYQEIKEIHKMNTAQFKFLKCVSDCPIVYSGNRSALKQSCVSNCTNSTNPTQYSKKYPQKQLVEDFNYVSCTSLIDVRDAMSFEKYQSCVIKALPIFQKKYSYLKNI